LVNFAKLIFKGGYWRGWLWPYGWQWIRPIFKKSNSHIYDLQEIGQYRKIICKLGEFDKNWFVRVFEPETKGVRVWEYGKLLTELNKLNPGKLLDVGSGGSLLPDYLAENGWEVTSLDLDDQMEKRDKSKNPNVKYVIGDMTKMKFSSNTFDVVVSISAIEHLDSWSKTKKALSEMKRVVKQSGRIFISTDFYLARQKSDNWVGGKFVGAYRWSKLKQMAKILKSNINASAEKQKLIISNQYSNYRGRYFTTVFLEGRK
jgi:ubiquinone/menaquinone biosynthesis C-methylase UbiE